MEAMLLAVKCDFNPRSPHGERRDSKSFASRVWNISIHAPRTGSDAATARNVDDGVISIHAPRTGSDVINKIRANSAVQFQSTLPARGATFLPLPALARATHFNPRSPHGERPASPPPRLQPKLISIHAPRTGSDGFFRCRHWQGQHISIHAPRTGSDGSIAAKDFVDAISIHAPRTGSDSAK